MIRIEIIKGRDLTKKQINAIDKIWYNEFGDPPMENYLDDIFFMLYDKSELVSIGALAPIKAKYNNKIHKFWGIGGIVSVKKGMEYGRLLIASILFYLKKNKEMGVGTCAPKNSDFYAKLGLKISKRLVRKFRKLQKPEEKQSGEDIIYYNDKNDLINKIKSNKSLIYIDNENFW